jgi:[ribosomal protein S5]-alanine N-acetyltransferase
VQLETENFVVRPLTSQDLGLEYFRWLQDPEVTRHLFLSGKNIGEEEARAHVDSYDGENDFFFGIINRDGKLIGTHSLTSCAEHKRCAMGVMIGEKTYWGKQVVVEVRSVILDFVFYELNCEKAEAGCYKANLPAIYNFQRLGWKLEGVRRAHRIQSDTREDLLLFGLLKEEWDARRQRS